MTPQSAHNPIEFGSGASGSADDWLDLVQPSAGRSLSDDHMLPMINIVFLLLIFFMLVGAITKPADTDVLPPESASALIPEISEQELVINTNGDLLWNGQDITLSELAVSVIQAPPEGVFSVKADASIAATDVIDVLDVLRSAGVSRVQLVTLARR